MVATMENPPPAVQPTSNRGVDTIRGQYHKFMLIPLIEANSRWFDAGPISIAVEARALGDSPTRMVRGPSIHVFDAAHREEFLRFDVFGQVLHYHYILNKENSNILWGYDPDANGPMIPWVAAALRDRLPVMLHGIGEHALAKQVQESGWDISVLPEVEKAAADALKPREDDLVRARQGMDWMYRWKEIHPQFNTVGEGEY
jgi:hypothetical protein